MIKDHFCEIRRITSLPQATSTTLTVAQASGLVLVANTTTMAVVLPAAARMTGKSVTIKKTHSAASAITIDGNASETIDGSATLATLDALYDTVTLVSDGTGWHVVAKMLA